MSANILNNIDNEKLGKRLRIARERVGLTQAKVAAEVGMGRTTLLSIEKGDRNVKPKELLMLSKVLKASVNSLLSDKSALIEPFNVQFRASLNKNRREEEKISEIIIKWQKLCQSYLELEHITSSPLQKEYPEQYPTESLPYDLLAENIAVKERRRLGLGNGPIIRIRDILEHSVGLRIFYLNIPSNISEIYAYEKNIGGCLSININHPVERQRWSLAHGYLHFLCHREKLIYHFDNQYKRIPESEKLAESFSKHFLMPKNSVISTFSKIKQKGKFTVTDLLTIGDMYGVGVETISLRLEELKLLPTGTWNNIKSRGFKVREAQEKLGLRLKEIERGDKYPIRYKKLAIDALENTLISEEKFCELLGVSIFEARDIVKIFQSNDNDLSKNNN